MFKKIKPQCESNSRLDHPEHQSVNTRVSEYLRKYGQGKIDELPKDSRPTVSDDRDSDQMLDDEFVPGLGTDELDVMQRLNDMKERLSIAQADLKATEKQKQQFDNAVKVINDSDASMSEKMHAYSVLDDLEKKGKISYARANS